MMTPRKQKNIRVRIAPSPTGYFHIGTARTALFNWIFAKQHKGAFIVRIEDTDKERSKNEFEDDILESLAWLGFDYDEGPLAGGGDKGPYAPYRQSQRTSHYRKYLEQLLAENKAYYCFCSKEELEQMKQSSASGGQPAVYNGRCRSLTPAEVSAKQSGGQFSVIRFKMPSGTSSFDDLIRGKVKFDNNLIGDTVIAKDLDNALYNFTAVIDDQEMEISHVLRGEEHLGNTPKQLVLADALGFSQVTYAHIPLILNTDRSKMSKRTGGSSLKEYREAGYLPEAIINFLALLGWHPVDDAEILSREALISKFSLERVQKGGAAFGIDKLDWFNGYYLHAKSNEEIYDLLKEFGALKELNGLSKEQILKIIALSKARMKKLSDFSVESGIFAGDLVYDAKLLIWRKSNSQRAIDALEACLEALKGVDFTKSAIERVIVPIAKEKGNGDVFWPLRVALSGRDASPGPLELLEVFGKEESLRRIEDAIKKFNDTRSPFKE